MQGSWLTSYWISTGHRWRPIGYGVTAWSVEDAMQLLREAKLDIPEDLERLQIRENVAFADLDQNHVVPNMGPMVLRGVWYPRMNWYPCMKLYRRLI